MLAMFIDNHCQIVMIIETVCKRCDVLLPEERGDGISPLPTGEAVRASVPQKNNNCLQIGMIVIYNSRRFPGLKRWK
jgi:hypothetical protein